jgi:hypothetical protein
MENNWCENTFAENIFAEKKNQEKNWRENTFAENIFAEKKNQEKNWQLRRKQRMRKEIFENSPGYILEGLKRERQNLGLSPWLATQ